MIKILNPTDCCGCEACVHSCPRQCIEMKEDDKGFLYPEADGERCIQCGLCEKVCPRLNPDDCKAPVRVSAAKNQDEAERKDSSSGGIFILLAKQVVLQGGVVFGVTYDENWMPVHGCADNVRDLKQFQGSKYVQSRISGAFVKAKGFLEAGRKVLFSGTPCQISGLKHLLGKEYENLLTVEVVCHGVPSPKVWRDYLDYLKRETDITPPIEHISFRDKRNGWEDYDFVIASSDSQNTIFREPFKDNLYMKCFLRNLSVRPSCFSCRAKGGRSRADISLGDFWDMKQYLPEFHDDKGVTLVHINSDKGLEYFRKIDCESVSLDPSVHYNGMYYDSTAEKYPSGKFWDLYRKKGIDCIPGVIRSMNPSLPKRLWLKVNRLLGIK